MINLIDSALKRVSIRLLRPRKSWKGSLKSILNVPRKNAAFSNEFIYKDMSAGDSGAHFMFKC